MQQGPDGINTNLSPEDQKLATMVLAAKDRSASSRWIYEKDWFRNILYYVGQQWITFQEGSRRWRLRNMPSWVPLPVTNRLASTANVIRSAVAQVIPAFSAVPMQENEKSVLSANAADKYLDVIMRESGFRAARRRMASWITMTGNGFILTEFDTSPDTGTVTIPGETCTQCGNEMTPAQLQQDLKCTKCGSTELVENPSISTTIPQGRIRVRALSPFEVHVNNAILELEDQPEILIVEEVSLQGLRQTYGKLADGVVADVERSTGQFFLNSLANVTASGAGAGTHGQSRLEDNDKKGQVTLYKLYIKTCEEYPEGILIVMTGDQHILEKKTPYPFRFTHTKRPFYPLIHVRYDDVPGRFWAKTPIDDLVPKQRQRNELESLFQTIMMRCANPVWLLPSGIQATPITGDPGIQVKYTPAGGMKPERLPGLDAPVTLVKFLEMIDNDFEEIANTFAVMKGKNPGSVRAASAIQMLLERGFGRYGSVFDNLEEAYEQWAVQALELWRQQAIFPRVQAVARTAGAWQFMEFLGSDLGEVDVRVEAGSTRPKSQAGRQMLVQQALQWGILNPNDPEQRFKLGEELGMTHLLMGAEADIKVVAEENMTFMTWAKTVKDSLDSEQNDPTVDPQQLVGLMIQTFPIKGNPVLDHHPTHVVHHRRFALTEEFRSLPDVVQALFVQHLLTAHYPFLLQEVATGIGPTGVMAGLLPQKGTTGQNTPQNGSAKQGGGPGGAQSPTGMGVGGGKPRTNKSGEVFPTAPSTSNQGTG